MLEKYFALKTILFAFGGMFFATFIWFWMTFGNDVVLAYAQGIMLMCM